MQRLAERLVGAVLLAAVAGCASQLDRGAAEFQQGNYDRAASLLTPLAKGGDPVAQHHVGVLWENGLGSTPQNLTEAAAWYSLSAARGHTPAMVSLARIQRQYAYDEEALGWLTLAAQSGNQEAVNDLRAWGKPVLPADLYATELGSEEPRRLEQADSAAARLTAEVGVEAASNDGLGVAPPAGTGWSAFLEASRRSIESIVPNTLAEEPRESGDGSDPVDGHDQGRPADHTPDETAVAAETLDDSIVIPGATAVAEWISGLAGLGGSKAAQ